MAGVSLRMPFRPDRTPTGNQSQVSGRPSGNDSHIAASDSNSTADGGSQNAPSQLLADKSDRRSVREKFNVDTRTGGASLRVPISTSPGRSGFGPSLELVYDSGSAGTNGIFGLGWRLAGVDRITRKTTVMIPTYDDDQDIFVHSSIGDLVPVIDGGKLCERPETVDELNYQVRRYRSRVESDPILVERWIEKGNSNTVHWKTISSGNITTIFGSDTSSRVTDDNLGQSDGPEHCFAWLAAETYDSHGNHMTFSYKSECVEALAKSVVSNVYEAHRSATARATQRYLKSIKYGNKKPNRDIKHWNNLLPPQDGAEHWMFEVVLDYGEHTTAFPTTDEDGDWTVRPDPFSVHTSGFEIRTYRRCQRVLMFHHFSELKRQDCLVSATEFVYDTSTKSRVSMLQSCSQLGYSPTDNGYSSLQLAPKTFEYWAAPDLSTLSVEELELDLSGLSTSAAQWVDLSGDGAPGVLTKIPGGWYYHPNNSSDKPAIGGPTLVSQIPSVANSAQWSFEDMTGDGQLDVTFLPPDGQLRGFYERAEDRWLNFIPLESYPTVYAELQKIDLNGNGLADLLNMVAQDSNEFAWYPSLGQKGYGAERRTTGAPPVPSGEARLVVLCDMVGDGLSDIVIVYNSHVCYWPNLGHGQFGSKVVMGHPPFLGDSISFSPLRIRMADVTGSGTADLVYLPPQGGVQVYYNYSGNEWSVPHILPTFPPLDHFCAVDIFDIGGRGTQCLCWTSDQLSHSGSAGSTSLHFIDLMGGCKPGLLTKCSNGIGAEVEISYRSSTRYRLDDEHDGKPWITRLPFPVNCVRTVLLKDLIAETACTTEYAYHNGYYDHVERQFRGFQMVEELKKEDFAALLNKDSSKDTPRIQFSRPKVHTKSWFYVGLQQIDRASVLPWSYQGQQPQHNSLPSAKIYAMDVSESLTMEEIQEAYRALAGQKRRQEIFAKDGSCKSAVPYLVKQKTYEVLMHQGAHRGQHGIFRVNKREEMTFGYEREELEPKVQHSVVLKTDGYGNIQSQVVINYGNSSSELHDQHDKEKQQQTIITYTATEYTNAINAYDDSLCSAICNYIKEELEIREESGPSSSRIFHYFHAPLPAEVQQYRIYPRSESQRNGKSRYSWAELDSLVASLFGPSNRQNYECCPVASGQRCEKKPKILISKIRTLYSKVDPHEKLGQGWLGPFSLKYQSYQLALTDGLLEVALRKGKSLLLEPKAVVSELEKGGYENLGGDEWWAPSTRKLFKSDDNDHLQSNIEHARSQFYIANAEVDQYGNVSHQCLDEFSLLPTASFDAVGNKTLFRNDYVHLQPTLITDANRNRTETVFDPCGRAVGIAVMGKAKVDKTKGEGDCLLGFASTLTEEELVSFMKDPLGQAKKVLGNATRRTIYNDRYRPELQPPVPPFRADLVRDTHYRDPRYLKRSERGGGQDMEAGEGNCREPPPLQIGVQITYLNRHGKPAQKVSLSGNSEERRNCQFSNCIFYDNKGQPVRELLPFTTSTHYFRAQEQNACVPATTLLRDALGRIVGKLNADHTWSKTRFTPWSQVIYDVGDTVEIEDPATDEDVGYLFSTIDRDSYYPTWYGKRKSCVNDEDKQAVCQSNVYSNTPTIVYMDPLGRGILTTLDNGVKKIKPESQQTEHDIREARTEYDAFGNIHVLQDSCGRIVTETLYDLLGRPLQTVNMDSGYHWLFSDCSGAPLLSRSNTGPRKRIMYDALRRKKKIMLLSDTAPEEVVIMYVYGDENLLIQAKCVSGEEESIVRVAAEEKNLKGQLYQCFDQSGKQTNLAFDFKGNCVKSSVQYAIEYKKRLDWSKFIELEEISYKTEVSYDALGHPVQSTATDGDSTTCVITRTYDVAGRLKTITSSNAGKLQASISNIEYSEDGKLTRIECEAGLFTVNDYDAKTRRLVNTRTTRTTCATLRSCVQDISYIYDCMGRIVHKTDVAQQDVFFAGGVVSPSQKFSYNALGQLTKATGREQVNGMHLRPYGACSTRNKVRDNGIQMIQYKETYEYDKAGNIKTIRHDPLAATKYTRWTRKYFYEERSCVDPNNLDVKNNRLSKTTSEGTIESYKYDEGNGCITSMPGYSLKWDHDSKLRSFSRQKTVDGKTPETTWYIYNAQGERVRKVAEFGTSPKGRLSPTKMKETFYLPLRDIYTKYCGAKAHEVTTVSVGDSSVARTPMIMVETIKERNVSQTQPPQHQRPLARYQISDHLELALELGTHWKVISYEEFSPYGASTYQSRNTEAPRKYRFTCYQRDSENGLYLCGQRYYAAWLGRWMSTDPLGTVDGLNLYVYVGNDPVNFEDPGGTAKTSSDRVNRPQTETERSCEIAASDRPAAKPPSSQETLSSVETAKRHTISGRANSSFNPVGATGRTQSSISDEISPLRLHDETAFRYGTPTTDHLPAARLPDIQKLPSSKESVVSVLKTMITFVRRLGLPIMAIVILGTSLMAIFGKVGWPSVVVVVGFTSAFFGASKLLSAMVGARELPAQFASNGSIPSTATAAAAPTVTLTTPPTHAGTSSLVDEKKFP